MVGAFTIVNKVSQIQSLIKCMSDQVKKKADVQTLEYHETEVFLCYMHTPSKAKVSLTENVNRHACGGEFDGLYTFTRD